MKSVNSILLSVFQSIFRVFYSVSDCVGRMHTRHRLKWLKDSVADMEANIKSELVQISQNKADVRRIEEELISEQLEAARAKTADLETQLQRLTGNVG